MALDRAPVSKNAVSVLYGVVVVVYYDVNGGRLKSGNTQKIDTDVMTNSSRDPPKIVMWLSCIDEGECLNLCYD